MVDKKCPFCGADSSHVLLNLESSTYGRIGYLFCDNCGARTKSKKLYGNPRDKSFFLQKSLLWMKDFWDRRVDGDGCPFCGSDKVELVLSESQKGVLGHLACQKCKVQTKRIVLYGHIHDNEFFKQEGINVLYQLWNTRDSEGKSWEKEKKPLT